MINKITLGVGLLLLISSCNLDMSDITLKKKTIQILSKNLALYLKTLLINIGQHRYGCGMMM